MKESMCKGRRRIAPNVLLGTPSGANPKPQGGFASKAEHNALRLTISNCPRAARGSPAKPSRVQGLTSREAVVHLCIKRK